MIAKIGRSGNLYGALSYNQRKVEKENGEILFSNKVIETADGCYTVGQLVRSFEPYLIANRNTEKHTLHISLNPDPKDKVSDERFQEIATDYMKEMGYGDQPYVVFKHTDIDRSHIHIVSVCVDEEGRKISDKFEKRRSMNVCRNLELKYNLTPIIEKSHKESLSIYRPVDYRAGDIKSQIASIIRHLPKYYKFQTLGEYNALLSLFNITTEKVDGELYGKIHHGILYFPLNKDGTKVGSPIKGSLLGKSAGIVALEQHFQKSKSILKDDLSKKITKDNIIAALKNTSNKQSFKKELSEKGINAVVHKNDSGRIYGMTFIDHNYKTVFNGSRLGKELSANIFNDYWNNKIQPKFAELKDTQPKISNQENHAVYEEKTHPLFEFIHIDKNDDQLINALGGLMIPEIQGEDYQELEFTNNMRKRKKKKRKP